MVAAEALLSDSGSSPFSFSLPCSFVSFGLRVRLHVSRKARRRARRKDGLRHSTSALVRGRTKEPLCGLWVWTPTGRLVLTTSVLDHATEA